MLDCSNRKFWLMNQFPDLSKFAGAEPLEWKKGQVLPRKDIPTIPKVLNVYQVKETDFLRPSGY